MTKEDCQKLPAQDLAELKEAVKLLEDQGFTRLLNNVAGKPTDKALELVPRRLKNKLDKIVNGAVTQGLHLALNTLDKRTTRAPRNHLSTLMSGMTGGLSGFFGAVGLAAELPITTTLLLRSIADIARSQGEDLSSISSQLACIEVLALGAPVEEKHAESAYYLARDSFSEFSGNAAKALSEVGGDSARAPAVNGFLGEVSARFAVTVWQRAAVSSVPLVGAVGGAAGNALFMRYFQDLATGHFIVRKLERTYGKASIRHLYMSLFASLD
jgi:hypothetical protein